MHAQRSPARAQHVGSRSAGACLSLYDVGKHALLAHDSCRRVLRHRALDGEDAEVGGPCRGALAVLEERRGRSVGAAASAASETGHLMISCARTRTLARLEGGARAVGGRG